MTVTSVATNTFLSDSTIFIRDELRDNVTDPIAAARAANEKFVMTAYPQRNVTYPIITVQNTDTSVLTGLGMQSELHWINIQLEVRIWARNVKERDQLTQEVINQLRDFELDNDGTVNAGIFGFDFTSAVNIDESIGDASIRSKVIEFQYKFVLGA